MTKTRKNVPKKSTFLLSLVLAVVMIASLAVASAFAGPEHAAELFDADPANHGAIIKVLERPMGVALPDTGFNFSATPYAFDGDTAGAQNVPALESISVSTEDGVSPDIWNRTDDLDLEVVDHDFLGIHSIERTVRFNLAALTFDRPGDYDYVIEMQDNAYPGVIDSTDQYLMRVSVEAGADGNEIASVTFFDFANNRQGEEADPRFVSTFTPGGGAFSIGKLVTGDGDQNAPFDFRVRLTRTAFVNEGALVDATIISGYDATISDHTFAYDVWYYFQLQHGWTMNFSNLPLGTAFMVEERADTNYDAKVEVVVDGSVPFTYASTERDRWLSSESALGLSFLVENRVIGPGENSVTFTNYFPTVEDAHILMDNLLWIVAAAFAAFAVVVLIVIVRKRMA